MSVMAQWLNKTWGVTPKKIYALEALSTSFKLNKDNNNDKAGQPSTNTRAVDLQSVSFETFLLHAVGVDVRTEISDWKALIGAYGPLFIGGSIFGPESIQLTAVDVSDIITDDSGRLLQAKIKMSFDEYAPEPSLQKTGEGSVSSSAAGITAPTSDKAQKKPSNPQIDGSIVMGGRKYTPY